MVRVSPVSFQGYRRAGDCQALQARTDLRELSELNFARFDAKLEQRLAEFRAELHTALADLRTDLIRWMFGFWVTTLVALAGLVLALRH